jgi:hypothetical protein
MFTIIDWAMIIADPGIKMLRMAKWSDVIRNASN